MKGEKLEGLQARYQVFDEVCAVPAGKFRRYHGQSLLAHLIDVKTLFLNGRDFFRVLRGIYSAKSQLKRIKPDVVFSKGGYVAVPVGIAAHQLGVPIITHDSDAVPGLANRIIGRWADIHAVGQPGENYDYPKASLRFTGIPVDERIKPVSKALQKDFKAELGLPADSLALLVSGGGLGSGRLNDLVTAAAPQLLKDNPELCILLVAGQQHLETIQEHYAKIPEAQNRVRVMGFSPDFYKYSGAADLIITRAGATSLAEFAIQGKACVVLPAGQLAGGHQLANVKPLKAAGAVEVLDDGVQPDKLLSLLNGLLQNTQGREALGAKLSAYGRPDAAKDLAGIILETATAKAGV